MFKKYGILFLVVLVVVIVAVLLWDDLRFRRYYEAKSFDYYMLSRTNDTCQTKVAWGICVQQKDEYSCLRLENPHTVICGKITRSESFGCERDNKDQKLIVCKTQLKVEK